MEWNARRKNDFIDFFLEIAFLSENVYALYQ